VVDAGSQEESASDNSPDEERNVDNVLIVQQVLLALVNFALAVMLHSPRPGNRFSFSPQTDQLKIRPSALNDSPS
jgi:hypothetical protein